MGPAGTLPLLSFTAPLSNSTHIASLCPSIIRSSTTPPVLFPILTVISRRRRIKQKERASGAVLNNLLPIVRATQTLKTVNQPMPFRMALVNARSITNKSFILNELIVSKALDFLFLTETWQRSEDYASLIELSPSNYKFICTPRPSGRGGGLAVVLKERFSCRSMNMGNLPFSSFELQADQGRHF